MLESIRFRPLRKTSKDGKAFGRRTSCRQIVLFAVCVVAAAGILSVFHPVDAYNRFMRALKRVASDFYYTSSRDVNDCGLILWTNHNIQKPQNISGNLTLAKLAETHFDASLPVVILFHGFSDSPSTTWTRSVSRSFLKAGRYNVFSVDWRPLARSPWYSTAANNAEWAGQFAAGVVDFLASPAIGVNLTDVHLIGASLGAHAAAIAGSSVKGGKVGRVTGLDPSGPLHYSVGHDRRLDPSDAVFVDVIHSAGKWVGSQLQMGHVDFYPNLGRAPQPGCEGRESLDLSCSHFMSWKIFSQSIRGAEYPALRCPNAEDFQSGKCCLELSENKDDSNIPELTLLGLNVDKKARGRYYLRTNGSDPLASREQSVGCVWLP